MKHLGLLLFTALALSCGRGPTEPDDSAFFIAGPWWVDGNGADQLHADELPGFWARVVTCVGRYADPERVTVHLRRESGTDPQPWFPCPGTASGQRCGGYTFVQRGNVPQIWALNDYLVRPERGESVRHEMIHVLLWETTGSPDADHDGPWWVKDKGKPRNPDGTLQDGLACQAR